MKPGINSKTIGFLFFGTFTIFTLILIFISYFNGKSLLEYMVTIYMGIILCGTASVLLIKEAEKKTQKEKLNKKQLSNIRFFTFIYLFIFTPASVVIMRLLFRKKALSDFLTLAVISLCFVLCYFVRSGMILRYTGKAE